MIKFRFIASNYKDTGAVWVLAQDGVIPPNAVLGGREGDADLYVARFYTQGHLTPGKLHNKTKRAYNPYMGKEHSTNVYQVLTHPDQQGQLKWVPVQGGVIPTGALQGGKENNHILYIGRAQHESRLICGKVVIGKLYIPLNGREIAISDNYEVLCLASVSCD